MVARAEAAAWPAGVMEEPMRMRSGCSRLCTAEPSARNSGLDRTSKVRSGRIAFIYH